MEPLVKVLRTDKVETFGRKKLDPALSGFTAYLVNRSSQVMTEELSVVLRPLGLCVRHVGVLTVLSEMDLLSQQELCERLWIDRATMVALIDGLEKLGFVKRTRRLGERRSYAISLTIPGRKMQKTALNLISNLQADLFGALDAPEQSSLQKLLHKFLQTYVDRRSEI